MNLVSAIIMPRETFQTQKDQYCMLPPNKVSKIVKLIETEQNGGCQGLEGGGGRDGRCCSTGKGPQACKMSKFKRPALKLCVYT